MQQPHKNMEACTGCAACKQICPHKAIMMTEDDYGFLVPEIDPACCTHCGLCNTICPIGKGASSIPLECYAAQSKDKTLLKRASSGAVFGTIANDVLKKRGAVFGVCMSGDFEVYHTLIESPEELHRLQGSKYVQSNVKNTYVECKELLCKGREVLFSGTPCQVAGLKAFLQKEYHNLLTMDVICHGVPSNKLFKDYINELEKRGKGKIKNFSFRCKEKGWGYTGNYTMYTKRKEMEILFDRSDSSYLHNFLKGSLYRPCCYTCEYAKKERVSDITIGDFWGIENSALAPILQRNGWNITAGISCILASTKRGFGCLSSLRHDFYIEKASIEDITEQNRQLSSPQARPNNNRELFLLYKNKGYKGIEKRFCHIYPLLKMKRIIPVPLKNLLKKVLKRGAF